MNLQVEVLRPPHPRPTNNPKLYFKNKCKSDDPASWDAAPPAPSAQPITQYYSLKMNHENREPEISGQEILSPGNFDRES